MGDIEHVVVLMLENRSFDHLLGLLSDDPGWPGARPGDAAFGNPLNPADPDSARVGVTADGGSGLGVDPPHSHASVMEQLGGRRRRAGNRLRGEPAMDGFVAAYARKLAGHEAGLPVVHWGRIVLVGAALVAGAAAVFALPWAVPLLCGALAMLAAAEWLVSEVRRRARALPPLPYRRLFVLPAVAAVLLAGGSAALGLLLGYWWRLAVLGVPAVVAVAVLVARKRRRMRTPPPVDPALARDVLRCLRPELLPVLATLARQFTVCTRWHCSVPGATWPNRNFVHAGTSDGTVDIEIGLYRNATVFERLSEAGASWHIYRDGMAQVMVFERLLEDANLANWYGIDDFAAHVAAGTLPRYSFIEPCHDGPRSNSQHPGNNDSDAPPGWRTDFERGEQLIASVYRTLLAHRAVFDRTMLVITYDEHGGFYDHVPPPTRFVAPTEALDGRPPVSPLPRIIGWFVEQPASRFRFRTLGPRVPAVVISPLVPPGRDDTLYDHTAIPATVRRLFAPGTAPLSRREDASATLEHLCSLATPRDDLPDLADLVRTGFPDVAAGGGPDVAAGGPVVGGGGPVVGGGGPVVGGGGPVVGGGAGAAGWVPRDDAFARQLRALAPQVAARVRGEPLRGSAPPDQVTEPE
jgi:hypothetical protein